MTTYFDSIDSDVHKLRRLHMMKQAIGTIRDPEDDWPTIESLRTLEEKLVYDVTLAAEWPGFPPDLREAVHKIVCRHAVWCRTVNAPRNARANSVNDHFSEFGNLSFALHSIFHEVAKRDLEIFSDSPLSPLRCLYAQGEEFREKLVDKPEEQ